MSDPDQPESFWNQPLAETLARLEADGQGLSTAQAGARLAQFGPNRLQTRKERLLLLKFLIRFNNPLVLLLLAASGISALTRDEAGFAIIGAIITLSITLDFVQEQRAGRAAEKLQQSVALRSSVLRDGRLVDIPSGKLVPGDVVHLAAGDLVPADCLVLEAKDFFVNQALLTGESYPVEKHARTLSGPAIALNEATNAAFMGTSVVSGSARALVCSTGAQTAVGRIADTLINRAPPTAFETGIRRFGMLIMRLTLLLVLFVFLVNALLHRPLLESLLFAVALAVGLTPELLPMIVSVTLARGALRMSKQHVIVKRLEAINNLGSMDVLCTDKTGTLTEGKIRLEQHVDPQGRESEQVLFLAYLNSAFESGLRSPLDDAILEHREIDLGTWRKIDEVPFDFERRRVSVLADDGAQRLLTVKGAPEDILRFCTRYVDGAAYLPLDTATRKTILMLHDQLAEQGFRVLGIAWRTVHAEHLHAVVDDESELIFAGFAAFLDPPKASAGQALSSLAASGIAVKIVTGDHELVTRHLCDALRLPINGVLTGNEIQQLDDPALVAQVDRVNLFCRVTPSQKNRIILALKTRGHTVGYLGDGVNDAPPLHSADIGISVDGAVDVAHEAADMILLKHDLNVLHDGVLEGRRTFGNIMKYIMMGTSSNFGNMLSMAGATVFLPFLPMLPVQILLNNLLYDVSEIPIPLDKVDRAYLARPKQWDMRFIRNFMWVIGPVSSLFDFLTFFLLLHMFQAGETLFHTGWFIESIATQVLVIFVIRTRGNPLTSRPDHRLVFASCSVVLLAGLLPFTPLAHALGFTAPPALFYAVLPVMIGIYLLLVESMKQWFYRRLAKKNGSTGLIRQ